jgi:hypothetical protein
MVGIIQQRYFEVTVEAETKNEAKKQAVSQCYEISQAYGSDGDNWEINYVDKELRNPIKNTGKFVSWWVLLTVLFLLAGLAWP